MKLWKRILLALSILVVDGAIFFLPICALLVAFVVVARPRWVLRVVGKLYGLSKKGAK